MAEMTDDDILAELGIDLAPKKVRARTPREERIIAGFEDIVKFRDEHGRAPQHGEDRDIFERLYAVRLDRLRAQPDCLELLRGMDAHGLLAVTASADKGNRRISEPAAGPLFTPSPAPEPADSDHLPTGTLYVLRSRSDHPNIAANRDLVHKIGITGGSVEARIAGAADDATFLLADVDIVATYKLYDVDRPRLERLIHRVLDDVRFSAEIPDRFGKPFRPREWFLVPLPVIDEIVSRIADGTLVGMTYDPEKAALVPGAP